MNDASNAETYLMWIQVYFCVLGKKNLRTPLDVATVDCKKLLEDFKKFSKVPKKEFMENKVTREVELAPTKVKLAEVTAIHAIASQACYDLFHQLLVDDPRDQWDHIVREVHESNPWTSLDGHKNNGLWMKTSESLEDCITFHKRMVFSLDAAEWQKSYMMGSLKKPHKMTIKSHVSRCEMMNGYIAYCQCCETAPWRSLPPRGEMYHSTMPHWLESYWPPVTLTGVVTIRYQLC
jgi:hypothetical protein